MKKSSRVKQIAPAALIVIGFLAGIFLGFVGVRWFLSGRVEYWTGSTEGKHFLATRDILPAMYWIHVSVFCFGALVLLGSSVVELIRRVRLRKG